MAKLDLSNDSLSELLKLCKEQMTQEVANHAVSVLTSHVADNEKYKTDYEKISKELETALKQYHEIKNEQESVVTSMKKWRFRSFMLCLAIAIICISFYVGGDDIARYFGQPGCMTFEESQYHHFRSMKYYLKNLKHYLIYAVYLIKQFVNKYILNVFSL
jgi:hypothetical protein